MRADQELELIRLIDVLLVRLQPLSLTDMRLLVYGILFPYSSTLAALVCVTHDFIAHSRHSDTTQPDVAAPSSLRSLPFLVLRQRAQGALAFVAQ